jgi:hypothetical protein
MTAIKTRKRKKTKRRPRPERSPFEGIVGFAEAARKVAQEDRLMKLPITGRPN